MSRIGKKANLIPVGVSAQLKDQELTIKGPKGELKLLIHPLVKAEIKDNQILLTVDDKEAKKEKSLWGLFGALVRNMIQGVTVGFSKQLEVNGVGYKVAMKGKNVLLNLGFSHPIEHEVPDGITCAVEKNIITVSGIDKKLVGEVAAAIRRYRKPEPYKGKGIKYVTEVLRHKAGKTAAAKA